ncbi:hypothetical protein SB379_29105 [Burkholderia multivorans]|jgi:hypothetical protein|uniref:hypothetical protein n=1 Tax=Burkholderia multivorans TaxID=87883 RepID=UPI001BA169FE|nr:hypothetical protein [Burkholderia multivorans]MBR8021259.1 hypothetical protein [Burkholderia multivorans]MBU9391880.1 hypothetical protein [Burkholderia multivorans]MEB2511335.1 hypothetical protein [Burkholderia multivorans]MEB2525539.1 hypothetical protein [Burkholderia multivorans]MEB2575738.1 hypothetical protein [Burkholderia multivorans]
MSNLYAIVENGIVTNVIVWDGNSDVNAGGWEPPAGATAVMIEPQPEIGWNATEINGKWTFNAPTT